MEKIIGLPKQIAEFVKESYAELKKVTWLSKQDVTRATFGVIIVVFFFATYVGIVDFIIGKIVGFIVKSKGF